MPLTLWLTQKHTDIYIKRATETKTFHSSVNLHFIIIILTDLYFIIIC